MHAPHPLHRLALTTGYAKPSSSGSIPIAPWGQAVAQAAQPQHRDLSS